MRFGSSSTPTVADSTERRDKLEADIAAFLARGGQINRIPQGVSGEKPVKPAKNHAKAVAQRKAGIYSDKKAGNGDTFWRKGVK